MKITFIGGDERMLFAAEKFAAAGNDTHVYGFDNILPRCNALIYESDLKKALQDSSAAVLPLPCTSDGKNVFAPFADHDIAISDALERLAPDTLLLGGKMGELEKDGAIDYSRREDFAILNAIPTAEGAVKLAIEHTKMTVCGMNTAVLGFGRIGKMLSKTLVSLGANVTVFARRTDALAWAKAFFCKAEHISELSRHIASFDCIFNTVPSKIIYEQDLALIKKEAVIIELASSPGCVDAEEAEKVGVNLINARGLPGKITPKSAGNIIFETLKEIIKEEYR